MRFSKGTVKNLNKKLAAGVLTLTLVTTSLVGCSSSEKLRFPKYEVNGQGYVQCIDGTVEYPVLEHISTFAKVKNNITEEEFYTILYSKFSGSEESTYYDIFTNQNISDKEVFEVYHIDTITKYLLAFNMVKKEYTEEDLRQILNKFVEIQTKENTKIIS